MPVPDGDTIASMISTTAQPPGADRQGEGVPRPVGRGAGTAERVVPVLRDVRGLHAQDERGLQQDVERRTDRHRHQDRAGQVLLRVLRLAGQLDGLLEALQREHDTDRERGEDAVRAERCEAAAGVEVARVEGQRGHRDDREHRHRGLPDDDEGVALGHELGAGEVHRGEQHHPDDGDDQAAIVQRPVPVDHREVVVHPVDAVDVGDRGDDLDRAIATACNQDAQAATKPAKEPCEKYGKRPEPPATGYAAPSSA